MKRIITAVLCLLLTQASWQLFGQVTNKVLELPTFRSIYVNSNYTVYLKQSNKQEVSVNALSEIYEISEFKVEDDVLHINIKEKKDLKNKSIWDKIDDIKISPKLKVMVSVRDISTLKVNGGGRIVSENSIASNDLKLAVTGSGSMDIDIKGRDVDTEVSGSGNMTLKGYASDMDLTVSGSGSLKAYDLELEQAEAKMSGSGNVELNVTDNLEAEIYGNGSLKHKGATKNVVQKVYGGGSIERAY